MKEAKQKKYDTAYLRIAAEWSKLSYCKRKQVGAIIVRDRMIISDGYNGTPSGFENCCEDEEGLTQWYVLHAEANVKMQPYILHFHLAKNAANSFINQGLNALCINRVIVILLVLIFF
jgi:deoxycytidylate deaminase